MDYSIFAHPETYVALLTLAFLEIVLGIDNIIFISIVTNKLPAEQQKKTRNIGLFLALIFRIAMLLSITWIIGFKKPLFDITLAGFEIAFSVRDLILFIGGMFLITKSTLEIHHKVEGAESEQSTTVRQGIFNILLQIVLLDIIFSFDSILTAIGMTDQVSLMIIAVVISIVVMMLFAGAVSKFINDHPTLQILALSFLILIGFMLVLESFHHEIEKGYIYFAVFFSLAVELINMRFKRKLPQHH